MIKAALALEGNVVDRKKIAQLFLHAADILRLAKHRDHSGVPVVAVDHLGNKVQIGYRIQNSTGKESILLQLRIPAAIYAVAEVALVIHQIHSNAVQHQLFYADVFAPPAQLRVKVEHMLCFVVVFVLDHTVIRRNDTGVNAQCGKRLRQRADNIRQTAGLGKRRTFGGYQKDGRQGIASALL